MTIIGRERNVLKIGQHAYPQTQRVMWLPQAVKNNYHLGKKTLSWGYLEHRVKLTDSCREDSMGKEAEEGGSIESQRSLCSGLSGRSLRSDHHFSLGSSLVLLGSATARCHKSHKIKRQLRKSLMLFWQCNLSSAVATLNWFLEIFAG